jgi:hypothetical protein
MTWVGGAVAGWLVAMPALLLLLARVIAVGQRPAPSLVVRAKPRLRAVPDLPTCATRPSPP